MVAEEELGQGRSLFAFYHLKRRGGGGLVLPRRPDSVAASCPTLAAHRPSRQPTNRCHKPGPLNHARVGRCLVCTALRVDALFSSRLAWHTFEMIFDRKPVRRYAHITFDGKK